MLFQPPILALLLAAAANAAALLAVLPFALSIVRHWDLRSGSQRQLTLERRTYLISALVVFVLVTQLLSLLLFVFNADRMAALFTGAMCAAGTLNADPYGFPALLAQIAVFFLAAMWLAINHVDVQAPDYPLVRVKYSLLLAFTPILAATLALEIAFFLGLKADVLTSCCSRLFTSQSNRLSGDLAALPPQPALFAFFLALAFVIAAAAYTASTRRGSYLLAAAGFAAFITSIAGIIAFLSLYVYESPNHHCPFCLLKAEYRYQGYWLYIPLFAATAAALAAGATRPFSRVESLRDVIPALSRRLALIAAVGFLVFTAAAAAMLLRSNLILISNQGVQP